MKVRLYIYSLIAIVISLFGQSVAANPHGVPESAMRTEGGTCIITTYSPEYRWSSRVINHVQQNLMTNYSGAVTTINIPLVSIDSKAELGKKLADLKKMLMQDPPRRIILVGSSSFSLCEKLNTWFPDVSMLLIGGQDFTGKVDMLTSGQGLLGASTVPVAEMRKKYNISLQCMPVYLEKEVTMIRTLMPGLRTLYFVGGDDQFSTAKENELRTILKKQNIPVKLQPLLAHEMTLDSLVMTLSKLNPKTDAVIFSSWVNRVLYKESPVLMSRSLFFLNVSTAPIFIMRENGWMEDSQDILGGCFLDETDFYRHLDRVLTMFAGGMPARQIPQYKAGAPIVKLNYARMQAYGIDPEKCPEGTIFTYKPMNVWEHYHNEITVAAVFFLLVLIVVLMRAYRDSVKIRHLLERELKAMEADLETKRQSAEFIENVPASYMRCHIETNDTGTVNDVRIIQCNSAMREKWEKLGKSVYDATFTDLMPLAAPSFIYKIQRCINEKKSVLRSTFYIPDTGEYIYMLIYFYSWDTIGVLTRDDTEIVTSARRLKEAKEKIERSERIKREFINNMSHEVRTPLNAICGFTELLTNPEISAAMSEQEKEEMNAKITLNTQQLVEMLGNILEYSDIVNGTSKNDMTLCSVTGVARMAMHQTAHWHHKGVKVSLRADVGDDKLVRMCQSRVMMVLGCVLSNACKFTDHGSIVLAVEQDEETGMYRYVCTDTGCGVPEEKAEFIFEGFTQIDTFSQGAGLGLAICKLIADEMGGKIYLDTTYKGGSRFVFELGNVKEE